MSEKHDKTKHSLKKLGMVGAIPVLPMVPLACQMRISMMGVSVHYKIDGAGHYVNGPLPGIPPSKIKAVKAALKKADTEPSYSGTGSEYVKLGIVTDPMTPDRFTVTLGDLPIGWGLIDPLYEIISTDEGVVTETTDDAGAEDGDSKPAGDASDPTLTAPPGVTLPVPDAATNPPETGADPDPDLDTDADDQGVYGAND